jgi:hypothetical protein
MPPWFLKTRTWWVKRASRMTSKSASNQLSAAVVRLGPVVCVLTEEVTDFHGCSPIFKIISSLSSPKKSTHIQKVLPVKLSSIFMPATAAPKLTPEVSGKTSGVTEMFEAMSILVGVGEVRFYKTKCFLDIGYFRDWSLVFFSFAIFWMQINRGGHKG